MRNPQTHETTEGMNSLTFIAGMGAGAFISTVFFILLMRAVAGSNSKTTAAYLESMNERNEIGRNEVTAMNHIARILCQHRNVTIADVSTCDDCGSVVDYDKETRNWK